MNAQSGTETLYTASFSSSLPFAPVNGGLEAKGERRNASACFARNASPAVSEEALRSNGSGGRI
jgi:hypothetical protein